MERACYPCLYPTSNGKVIISVLQLVDHIRKNQEPMKKSVLMNGEIAGSGEMCSGEDTSSGAAEEITGAIDRSLWTTTEVEGNNSRIITKKNNEWAVIPTLIRRIRRNSDSWDYDIICKE
ncbi:hypothetical protein Tco_0936616 [Tanacetum coccineum]|uniref:Uncharacterized protein n=1 Tax=Tanacetum coccineum TaxID=301880 RepID=A0ABQ5DEQ0_9ASTR